MARRGSSNTLFWAKHIGLALALIIIAAVVISLQNINLTSPRPEGAEEKKSVSDGMTKFYAAYRMSSTKPFEEDIGDFVMEFNTPNEPLNNRLKRMESMQNPISTRWVGEHKYRSFRAGSTLREAITGIAQSEGMQVIWELDKDFIIKHQFQMENTITGAMGKIATAVNGSFANPVSAFLCPKQRSLVITDQDNEYLTENCSRIES